MIDRRSYRPEWRGLHVAIRREWDGWVALDVVVLGTAMTMQEIPICHTPDGQMHREAKEVQKKFLHELVDALVDYYITDREVDPF